MKITVRISLYEVRASETSKEATAAKLSERASLNMTTICHFYLKFEKCPRNTTTTLLKYYVVYVYKQYVEQDAVLDRIRLIENNVELCKVVQLWQKV